METLTNNIEGIASGLDQIKAIVSASPWGKADVRVGLIVGLAGLLFSFLAFVEAKRAKVAATKAGKSVKIQTITVELRDISHLLGNLEEKVAFHIARDRLNEVTQRLKRHLAPIAKEADFAETVTRLYVALDEAKKSLNGVRPEAGEDAEAVAPNSVYNAVEANFAAINGLVAEVTGLCEWYDLPHGGGHGS